MQHVKTLSCPDRDDQLYEQACALLTPSLLSIWSKDGIDPSLRARLIVYCHANAVFNDIEDDEIDAMIDDVIARIERHGVRYSFFRARSAVASSLREGALSMAMRLHYAQDPTAQALPRMIEDMAKLLRVPVQRVNMLDDVARTLQSGAG